MKLSNRSQYGVRALFDIAYYGEGRTMQIHEISKRQGIPRRFLEQIFFVLKKAGMIDSTRGPKGGYSLHRAPGEISVGDIIRVLEGPIEPVPCTTMEEDGSACHYIDKCVTRRVWEGAGDLLTEYFDAISLEDLCRRANELGLKGDSHCLMFSI
ncbi:MAG: Rrf2 family transcriptional regulator [Deltaproteobacteria bacterium]|nr:Rrf2 family transcriptional regulator [Deltaproteobacteria bacterium]